MKPRVSMREALADENLLGAALQGESWRVWRVLLIAMMGEPLEPQELEMFTVFTGRATAPGTPVEEVWGIAGRRGGKSKAMSTLALYFAAMCDYGDVLSAGERGVVTLIAPDQRQSRILLDYAEGGLTTSPVLQQLFAGRVQDTLSLSTGIDLEVRSASFRRLRGVTNVAVLADEAAYWLSDESANPDTEILNAVRPSLATTRGPLIVIGSPYARKGEVWNTYSRHFGSERRQRRSLWPTARAVISIRHCRRRSSIGRWNAIRRLRVREFSRNSELTSRRSSAWRLSGHASSRACLSAYRCGNGVTGPSSIPLGDRVRLHDARHRT